MKFKFLGVFSAALLAQVVVVSAFADETTDAWIAKPMSRSAEEIVTDGDLVWAMATGSNDSGMIHTANGVGFGDCSLSAGMDYLLSDYITTVPAFNGEKDRFTTEELAWNDMNYGSILKRGWVCEDANNGGHFTLTVKNLEKGKRYLVQLIVQNPGDGSDFQNPGRATDTLTSPDGQATITYGGTDWTYGGTLYRAFTATGTSESFAFTHTRTTYFQLNAIQLRYLGEGGGSDPGTDPDPSEETPTTSIAERAANLLESQGWLAAQMTGSSSDIVTDGYVVTNYWNNNTVSSRFAYSANEDIAEDDPSVGGVPFSNPGPRSLSITPFWGSSRMSYYYGLYGSEGNASSVTSGYDRLLTGGWNSSDSTNRYTFTINDLEPRETYLVQLIIHSNRGKSRAEDSGLWEKFAPIGEEQYLKTAVIGGETVQYGAEKEGDAWWNGGTFVKVFSADRYGKYSFEVYYPQGSGLYNAIQVRKVDRKTAAAEPVEKVPPQLGSVRVATSGSRALVTFDGLNRGSGTDGLMAKSVDVYFSCAQQGSELPPAQVVATSSEQAATALLSGLSAGVYSYSAYAKNSCGQSESVSGTFTISADADPASETPILVINEVLASNLSKADGGLGTENGCYGLDWVEIYNDSELDIDITGWYLYDDPTAKVGSWKRIKGDCIVPAKGYKLVWCDKDYDNFAINEAYARISLSTAGETVFLASPDGTTLSTVAMPSQIKGISYGLGKLSGSSDVEYVYFATPTPGAANGEFGAGPMTPKVAFSVPHGYKSAPVDVEITCADDPSAAIYYTTDGTSPTTASIRYTGPIHIDHTTCLRAAVPRTDTVLQQDASATYIYLDDVLSAASGVVPAGFPTPTGEEQLFNGQHLRYGLIQSVVNGPDRDRLLRGFTNSVGTISLVIDPANLFSEEKGIYVNAKAKYDWQTSPDDDWERPMLIEQIDPVKGAANEFSAPAGIRIRGAGSRDGSYAKHAFKVIFRSKYGMGKLAFPLFGEEGADEYERFDLRSSQNHSWANEDGLSETFIHEVFSRDSQRDMGELYTRSRYYNLFINGVYWGLYQSQERADSDFAATYNGGNPDNYDQVKTSCLRGGYRTVVEGEGAGWNALIDYSRQGFSGENSDNYMKLLGCDPDGTRNPSLPCYLNPTNLMVYMISAHYACDSDGPAAPILANNLYLLRDRVDGDAKTDGFFFLRHDAEHSLGVREDDPTERATTMSQYANDPTGYGTDEGSATKPQTGNWSDDVGFNPAQLHWQLCKNALYRRAFGDQFYRHCLRPGGAMTEEKALARFRSRMAEIDDAIVGEAARWSKDATAPKSHEDWLQGCGYCIDFITNRMPYMVSQYRNRGWYPSVDTPEPDVWDGSVSAGQIVTFTLPNGAERRTGRIRRTPGRSWRADVSHSSRRELARSRRARSRPANGPRCRRSTIP